MVFLLNKTIKNILSNYIRHEIIICDDRDPPWINIRVKELINEKSDTFQCYLHSNKDPKLFSKVEYLQNKLKELPSLLFKRTENVISSMDFGLDGIAKIIHNLDSEFRIHNVVPVHKKGNKQTLENYHQVSLLPICGKIFERLICNSLFDFFFENELISSDQSGFKPGDSCINQLLSIIHEI